jgi:hypothetical protein
MKDARKGFLKAAVLITLGVLICLVLLMYAFVQKAEADKQRELATKAHEFAQQNERESILTQQRAQEAKIEIEAKIEMDKLYAEAIKLIAEKDSIIQVLQKKRKLN